MERGILGLCHHLAIGAGACGRGLSAGFAGDKGPLVLFGHGLNGGLGLGLLLQKSPVEALLGAIALFKQIALMDPGQLEVLLRYSQILDARPGEVVIESGQIDTWLYFLLKGQLVVYAGEPDWRRVNTITPGEIFGDMAILMDLPRSATVIADIKAKHSVIVRTDFSVFGEPEDLGCITLPVKLLFYRTMVHNLRWKLEVYRTQFPHHGFATDHRKVRLYAGPRDTLEELLSLDGQARDLAALLIHWNLALTRDDT